MNCTYGARDADKCCEKKRAVSAVDGYKKHYILKRNHTTRHFPFGLMMKMSRTTATMKRTVEMLAIAAMTAAEGAEAGSTGADVSEVFEGDEG